MLLDVTVSKVPSQSQKRFSGGISKEYLGALKCQNYDCKIFSDANCFKNLNIFLKN